MKKKKILVLSASAGAGHGRAAEALVEWAKKLELPVETLHEDILSYTFPLFKKIYSEIQYAVVNHSPELWGYLYKKTEFKGTPKPPPLLVKLFNQVNYKKYFKHLTELAPDAVVCTHFLPYAAVPEEMWENMAAPFFAVTTDYDVHSLWVSPHVREYYVATDEAEWALASHGIAREKICVTGIPVHPQFEHRAPAKASRLESGMSPDAFTIMILGGGYTQPLIMDMARALTGLLSSFHPKQFQIAIVCGKNERLRQSILRLDRPANLRWHAFPHINFVDRLMDSSDILISKSGGMTVTEALAKNLPMIIFDPIPGQEGRNATYLLEHGAALSAHGLAQLAFKVKQLIESPSQLEKMRRHAARTSEPTAAGRIWKQVLK